MDSEASGIPRRLSYAVFPWGTLATATAVALLLGPLVGLLPARWAARLDVVEALRYE
ncbi:MAG TPA: hypothetical protein VK464_18190 [Symbiobacteriaceae bacterium]|nr:hypothetical protein [Symbiobacteriaceae bacterium]